jgi:AraC-like DNA-binding protein
MDKRVSTISVLNFFTRFFRDKISISICFISFFILVGSYFSFFQKKALLFFPDKKNVQTYFYNDKIDNGNSIITDSLVTDSFASMKFVLNKGFISPYASIGLENKLYRKFDISAYNRVKFQISAKGLKSILVYLILKDDEIQINKAGLKDRLLSRYIDIDNKNSSFDLSIDDFKTPDWWYDKYNLSPTTTGNINRKFIYRITFGPGLMPTLNKEQSIKIHSIIFYRDNTLEISAMVVIQLIIMLLLLVWFYFKTRTKNQIQSVTINYQAVKLDQKTNNNSSFLDFISENFYNSELSLLMISEKTGVSQRNIGESILTQFNCNIKTYINQIRINEAQRLLKETELNVSEIAYKTGFSSPSNFNRVFKKMTGKTPSEYSQNKE